MHFDNRTKKTVSWSGELEIGLKEAEKIFWCNAMFEKLPWTGFSFLLSRKISRSMRKNRDVGEKTRSLAFSQHVGARVRAEKAVEWWMHFFNLFFAFAMRSKRDSTKQTFGGKRGDHFVEKSSDVKLEKPTCVRRAWRALKRIFESTNALRSNQSPADTLLLCIEHPSTSISSTRIKKI